MTKKDLLLLKLICEDCIRLYTLLEKQLERKSAWTKEDERMFNSALWHIKNSCGNGGKNSGEFEVYHWLKSLKERMKGE